MPTQDETTEVTTEEYKPNRATRRAKPKSNRATFAQLRSKAPQEKEVVVRLGDDEMSFLFRSIGAKEWDLLVSKHPPTNAQRADGNPFNTDTFPPALMARVCVEPVLSSEEWTEIWESDTWSRGEIGDLYAAAVNLCTSGFNIPFSASA
jgi:hypothetical protein